MLYRRARRFARGRSAWDRRANYPFLNAPESAPLFALSCSGWGPSRLSPVDHASNAARLAYPSAVARRALLLNVAPHSLDDSRKQPSQLHRHLRKHPATRMRNSLTASVAAATEANLFELALLCSPRCVVVDSGVSLLNGCVYVVRRPGNCCP